MSRGLRYRVTRKLAQGGMAEIFLARQVGAEGFEKSVVLKRILPALAADPGFVRMLVDEAHIASLLNHSHLVQVLDLGKAGDQFFLALEFVDGFSLEQIRQRARKARMKMPLPLALYIVSSLCRGLDYAHRRTRTGKPLGIVHRDVTPQNVLISREGDVKLADFGIAKARGRRERSATGVIKGKFAYMSPEQSIGGELDARSDLFSVGTLLYVLTTGKKPFEGTTDLDVILQVRRARYEKPSNLVKDYNLDVERFIARAMRADKTKRWQSAEQMADRLDAILFKIGQPTGPAALKRWLELLCSRDGVRFPGDLREEPDVSNETIQLTSEELELEAVVSDDGNDEEDLSLSPTQAATWHRAPEVVARSSAPKTESVVALDEFLAATESEPDSEPDNDDAIAEYDFTLSSPPPGNTVTRELSAEPTQAVHVQTTVIVGQPERTIANAPAVEEPTPIYAAPITALSTIDGVAVSAQPPPPTYSAADSSVVDTAADTLAAPDNFVAQVARYVPNPPRESVAPREPIAPVAAPRLALALGSDLFPPPRAATASARASRTDSAAPLWLDEEDEADESPVRKSAKRGFIARTASATAMLLLTATVAGAGAYAARPYLPPWIASNPVVQHVDTFIADVPEMAARVSERAKRAF